MDTVALNKKFGLPNGALIVTTGEGGLPCIDIATEAVKGRVYFLGGHISRWQPAGHEPVLWMSGQSWFEAGKPIRGGIPVCFPWFGPHPSDKSLPAHGFARIMDWELEATRLGDHGKVALVMLLKSNEATRKFYPYDFELRQRITFGDQLIVKLEVTNTGKAPITFEEALHTYMAVSDARKVQIVGCESVAYIDKVDGLKVKSQEGEITFTGETDRVYLKTKRSNVLLDPGLKRRITIQKTDSESTVVWNPWIEKSKRMPDFGDDEWTGMCCIETANVGEAAVSVNPGDIHQLRAIISCDHAK